MIPTSERLAIHWYIGRIEDVHQKQRYRHDLEIHSVIRYGVYALHMRQDKHLDLVDHQRPKLKEHHGYGDQRQRSQCAPVHCRGVRQQKWHVMRDVEQVDRAHDGSDASAR